jgi:drug/metabolite transporter (DMT)-like permease
MTFTDWLRIVHPVLAVTVFYPLLGMAVYFAWKTRQRRLQLNAESKSATSPTVGLEHVYLGRLLTGAATGLALLGLVHPITKTILKNQVWLTSPSKVMFVVLVFTATIASLTLLYRAKARKWRALFALLTSLGLVVLGMQDGVFRRSDEWYFSHYYYGITVAILMIIALAILPEVYRHLTWRKLHIGLNVFALILFLGQGLTGVRDLLEIPLSWQESTIFKCDFVNRTCASKP